MTMETKKEGSPRVFISGPITGREDTYRAEFAEAAKRIEAAGCIPLNSAMLPDGLTERECMRISLAMLECANAVAQLPGWEDSAGAKAEAAYAEKIGVPTRSIDWWVPKLPTPEPKPTETPEHGSRTERLFGKRDDWQQRDKSDQLVKGFLIIQCAGCGEIKTMCAKLPTDHFHCRLCGYDTPLQKDAMFMAYANCPACGKRAWYRTNAGKERMQVKCIDCSTPIDLKLNWKRDTYITDENPAGGGGQPSDGSNFV